MQGLTVRLFLVALCLLCTSVKAQFGPTYVSELTQCSTYNAVSFDPLDRTKFLATCKSTYDSLIFYQIQNNQINQNGAYNGYSTQGQLKSVKYFPGQSTYAILALQYNSLQIVQISGSILTPIFNLSEINQNFTVLDINPQGFELAVIWNGGTSVHFLKSNYTSINSTADYILNDGNSYTSIVYCDSHTILLGSNAGIFQYNVTNYPVVLANTYSFGILSGLTVYNILFASFYQTQGILSTSSGTYQFSFNGSQQGFTSPTLLDANVGVMNTLGINADNSYLLASVSNTLQLFSVINSFTYCQVEVSATACAICQLGYSLTASSFCEPCSAINTQCSNCSQTSAVCTSCQTGYFLASPSDCEPCSNITGCATCSQTSKICNTCAVGYYFASANTCVPCSNMTNCATCSQIARVCTSCQLGYYLASANTCLPCSNIANCLTCNQTGVNCLSCSTGYQVSTDQLSCQYCSIITAQCATCSTTTTCTSCNSGYYLATPTSCLAQNAVNNCNLYSQTSNGCISCHQGFYLANSAYCLACSTINNCNICNQTSNSCVGCTYGFYLANSTSCLACNTIKNCSSCSQSSNACTTCASGFYLAANSQQCLECSTAVANCSTCSDPTGCTSCSLGYYLATPTYCEFGIHCQAGYYFSGSQCWSCPAQCATCSNSNTCTSCVGTQNQTYSRILSQNCVCPTYYYDNIVNSPSDLNCQSTCASGYVEINQQCILDVCLSIDLSINFNDFQFALTSSSDYIGELQYELQINYTGTLAASISTCYSSYIYFVQNNSSLIQAPNTASGNSIFTSFLHEDLAAYGCAITTTPDFFTYNCSLSYQAYILELQQINLNFSVGITVDRGTSSVLSLGVNYLASLQSCVACNTQYSVSTNTQLVNSDGTPRTNSQYSIGDAMIFLVQIQDPSLRSLYYVDLISVTLTSGSISFTLTPSSTVSSVIGQLTVNITASLAVPNATLTIIGQLSLSPSSRRILGTQNTVTSSKFYQQGEISLKKQNLLRGRMLQQLIEIQSQRHPQKQLLSHLEKESVHTKSALKEQLLVTKNQLERRVLQSSGSQLLKASYQISIVNASQNKNIQQESIIPQKQQSITSFVVIVVATVGGIVAGTIIACVIYHKMCKNKTQQEQLQRSNQLAKTGVGRAQHLEVYTDVKELYIDEEGKINDLPQRKLKSPSNYQSTAKLNEVQFSEVK